MKKIVLDKIEVFPDMMRFIMKAGMVTEVKTAVICNPLVMALIGQAIGLIPLPFSGID